jgi:hypothetical protein
MNGVSHIQAELEAAGAAFKEATEEFMEGFNTNPSYTLEWKTGRMILAQARYEIALDLLGEGDDPDFKGTLMYWQKQQMRHLDNLVRTESKSTSAMSNIIADGKAQATLELLEKISRLEEV